MEGFEAMARSIQRQRCGVFVLSAKKEGGRPAGSKESLGAKSITFAQTLETSKHQHPILCE